MNDSILAGAIRIGFKGDTKELERDLSRIEKELKQYDKQKEALAKKSISKQQELNELQKEIDKYDKLNEKAKSLEEQLKSLNNERKKLLDSGYISVFDPKMEENYSQTEKVKSQIQEINSQLQNQESSHEKIATKYEKAKKELTEINGKIVEIEDNQTKLNEQAEDYKSKISQVHLNFNNLTKNAKQGINSLIKGAKKLTLGIVGAYSAYSLIRKAASNYLSNDEKLQKQLQANWIGLGAILEPVIKVVIELFKKAVTGVLYFFSILTGQNLIEKANTLIKKNQTKATKDQTKATKDLTKANEKFSASFDEINMVQEKTTTQTNQAEPFDTSLLFNLKDLSQGTIDTIKRIADAVKPIWEKLGDIVNWAKDHPDLIAKILGGTALLILLSKIMGVTGISGLLGINSILLGLAAIGVISIVINVKRIQESINEAKTAANILKSHQLEKTEQVKAEQKMTRASIEGLDARSEATEKLYDDLDSLVYEERAFQKRTYDMLHSMSKADIAAAKLSGEWEAQHTAIAESIKREEEYISTMYELVDQNKLSAKSTKDASWNIQMFGDKLYGTGEEAKMCAAAFSVSSNGIEDLKEISDKTAPKLDNLDIAINRTSGAIKNLLNPTLGYNEELDTMSKKTDTTKSSTDNLSNSFNNATNKTKNIKGAFEDLTSEAKTTKTALDDVTTSANKIPKSKTLILSLQEKEFNSAIKNIRLKIGDLINKNYVVKIGVLASAGVLGGEGSALDKLWKKLFPQTTYYGAFENMATGGIHIVNNPGKGVISGGARYGEAGAEGIIPLTDESALEELGASIGKHVVIYTTMINQINGRTLSKEVKEIMAQSDFASNG